MMDELNTKSNIIDKLIKKCEQSNLASFAYQDAMFSIHFSKVETGENHSPNLLQKVTNENSSESKNGSIETDLDECALTDTREMDTRANKDIVIIVSPFVGRVEFSNQIKLVDNDIYVHKGDVICSIEAMKIFNDIKAPVSGTVVNILVEDCGLVEYEQPILKIRVDKNE